MKLLMVTQKIDKNDSVLGFFHRWVEEFSKHCEKVTVICLEKGEYTLPPHVSVLSLGKEKKNSRVLYLLYFFRYIFQNRKEYDSVLVHMNPEYIVLAGWFWKLLGKKIGLWYVHKKVDTKLKIAEKFVDSIFTVTEKSFDLKSNKIISVGHGIDTEYFSPSQKLEVHEKFEIYSVGRITKIKRLEILIDAVAKIPEEIQNKMQVHFVGSPVTEEDKEYKKELEQLIFEKKLESKFIFEQNISFAKIRDVYTQADVCVNLAPTGGIDKVVLEALSSGVPTLFCNKAFLPFLQDLRGQLFFEDSVDLSQKIMDFETGRVKISSLKLHEIVVEGHDVKELVKKIVNEIKKNKA